MEQFMKRAIELAKKGDLRAKPNPRVGALIIKNNNIIGEGYHIKSGSKHAEINAIDSATESVNGATMYVTLEPCSHVGKTGSCAKAIIENGIKTVHIASLDPNPLVSGKGVQMLKDAGIDVFIGEGQKESDELNDHFYHYITKKRPFICLKMGLSMDGKYATDQFESKWITNGESRTDAHEIRATYQAIMVGVNTVIKDNPSLTVRLDQPIQKQPIRIILDTYLNIPLDAKLLHDANETWIIYHEGHQEKIETLKYSKITLIKAPIKEGNIDLSKLLFMLFEKGIQDIIVEGGRSLHESFIREGLFDEVQAYIAPLFIGGSMSLNKLNIKNLNEAITLDNVTFKTLGNNIKITGRPKQCSQE
jgi:diaminohydroxyphosphoribosylaminopyrimidine deaminase/5-amino-6-(5-phosphoribosylamino)uracil reductase